MVGDLCNGINAALSTYHQLGVLLPGEAICFGVVPTLQPIACGLIAAGLVITPLNLFVMHAASEVLYRDAERKETVAHPKLGGERGWTITTLSVIPPDAAVGSSSRDAPLRL
uniref:Uncharacterized protein n=1 Tax=Haptolina ericina TaxID=156174 RepID=A0A7S3ES55_9EUKA